MSIIFHLELIDHAPKIAENPPISDTGNGATAHQWMPMTNANNPNTIAKIFRPSKRNNTDMGPEIKTDRKIIATIKAKLAI